MRHSINIQHWVQRACILIFLQGLWVVDARATDKHRELAERLATQGHLQMLDIQSGEFLVRTWARIDRTDHDVSVYIEGDGHAWSSRTRRSADPTPHNPIGLRIAVLDTGVNVIYLSRPCMYVPLHYNPACNPLLWTDRRFSEAVVAAMDGVLGHARRNVAGKLHLAGFSGGGAIAALLAARRTDIASLRTFGGNLDHDAVNRHHDVSPMPESLNPIDFAHALAHLPQVHFSGAQDAVVPPFIARDFIRALPTPGCARQVVLENTTHHRGWHAHRAQLLKLPASLHPWCKAGGTFRWRRVPVDPEPAEPAYGY